MAFRFVVSLAILGCVSAQSPSPSTPPEPPSPPTPPKPPPAPPQKCIPKEGGELPKTTAATPVRINDPCYSHSDCKNYANPEKSGYVCCVKAGTCGNLVSANSKYYQGGCIGLNYKYNSSYISSTSSASYDAPSVIEGCAQQGECVMPYLEQIKAWTATGSATPPAQIPDATMSVLLTGSISTPAGGCRDLYPYNDVFVPTQKVTSTVTVNGELSDYTTSVLAAMESNVAIALDVPKSLVKCTATPGSVLINIEVSTQDAASAADLTAKMDTAMSSNSAAGQLLSTPGLSVVASGVVKATTAVTNAPPAAPPPTASSGLSTGAIAGIAIGCSLGVIAIIVVAMMVMKSKKKTSTKGVPDSQATA